MNLKHKSALILFHIAKKSHEETKINTDLSLNTSGLVLSVVPICWFLLKIITITIVYHQTYIVRPNMIEKRKFFVVWQQCHLFFSFSVCTNQWHVTLLAHFLLLLSSSTVDTLRLIVPLCWLLAALISVWVLWEHDIVERVEMTVCMCVCEGVNSIPTVEMAFKCLSLCSPILLQSHYHGACVSVCLTASVCACACVWLQMYFRALPPIVSMLPRDSPSTFLFWSFSHSSCFPSCPLARGLFEGVI